MHGQEHFQWLVQINTISSLQHCTMLQCDEGIFENSCCALFLFKQFGGFVKGLYTDGHCAAMNTDAPLRFYILSNTNINSEKTPQLV